MASQHMVSPPAVSHPRQYLLHKPISCVAAGFLIGTLSSVLGGRVGELFRAIAVALLLALERRRVFLGQFPVMMQLKCILLRRRSRFPPNAPLNLRAYRPTPECVTLRHSHLASQPSCVAATLCRNFASQHLASQHLASQSQHLASQHLARSHLASQSPCVAAPCARERCAARYIDGGVSSICTDILSSSA